MSSQTLSTILFLVFVAATLGITFWASRQTKTAADYYAGGRSFSGAQNGLAIGGDYMSAASFLGIAGIIALSGYDGFLYSIGFLVAWLVALLLVAELMRNSGKFTMADVLAFRMSPRPVRTAAGVSTIVVSIFYLLAQMVGAGALVTLLLGVTSETGKALTIVGVGVLMIIYVVVGGMKGTTWVQIVKAVLLMGGATLVTLLVLGKYGFNLSSLLGDAAAQSGKGEAFLKPGLKYGTEAQGLAGKLDLISLGLALVLGTAGLPHILIRFYTVPTAKDARKSVLWGIGIIGSFYLLTLVLGFGAAALVGSKAMDAAGNTAAPLLAQKIGQEIFGEVGGTILLAIIAAVAFATILAVVAGLTLASSSSFAHDLYAHVFKRGNVTDKEEVLVARVSAFVIGAFSIGLGILAQGQNVAFLVALAFAVAASGNLPAILYSLFWKDFNTAGATSAIYGGLVSALVLVIFSPVVSGGKTSLFPGADFAWFPLSNPGLLSIPIGFLAGWIGTKLSKEYNSAKYAEIEVRALTGVGAEKAAEH
ncbi:cation acetate symporter [Planomonospora parontospora subsp. parontospora]|uniref:Cation acetate symporter n=2 Tax=Planomonospora parontospora TaxID=58119 RepID=A0AA37BIN1_9ACTN|nr:cation acetate symporter [Planomonospora parontospora]GGK77930.1 cation acetate symporter [Planomonospora parontospora]GII10381.1 cation acetate symporter [Planomonospora parontospora subsp. parontospora]